MPDPDRLTLDDDSRRHEGNQPVTDVGHTSGGGSLGHDQPADVRRNTPTRNVTGRDENADPVMPSDDATLKTKI
jgi:hypothetical protein